MGMTRLVAKISQSMILTDILPDNGIAAEQHVVKPMREMLRATICQVLCQNFFKKLTVGMVSSTVVKFQSIRQKPFSLLDQCEARV